MSISNQLNRWVASGLLVFGLAAWSSPLGRVYAAEPNKGKETPKVAERCHHFRAMREKMLERMKANDAELQKMVAKMNKAPENKKVDMMAAIVTKMAEQRHKMLERMEAMNARMLQRYNRYQEMSKKGASAQPMLKGQGSQG